MGREIGASDKYDVMQINKNIQINNEDEKNQIKDTLFGFAFRKRAESQTSGNSGSSNVSTSNNDVSSNYLFSGGSFFDSGSSSGGGDCGGSSGCDGGGCGC